MIEKNVIDEEGTRKFHFQIPLPIFYSSDPKVKNLAWQFVKFINMNRFCLNIETKSANYIHDQMDQCYSDEFMMKEVIRLNNSVHYVDMMSVMISEMFSIQQSIVKLDTLLCISVTSLERSIFSELFSQYIYFFIGNVFVIYILKRNPMCFFALLFIQQLLCILLYHMIIGNAIKIKNKFWTFNMLEEWKNKPRKAPLLRRFKSSRRKKFKYKFL